MGLHELYWGEIKHSSGRLYLAATAQGLVYVGSPDAPHEEMTAWAHKHAADHTLTRDDQVLQPYAVQLLEYLDGKRQQFELPLDLRGTAFQRSVWNALLALPYGETSIYSDLAAAIGKPNAVRAVGTAIGANPLLIVIPCHRVIGKNGTLTGYRGGLEVKSWLLQLEKTAVPV